MGLRPDGEDIGYDEVIDLQGRPGQEGVKHTHAETPLGGNLPDPPGPQSRMVNAEEGISELLPVLAGEDRRPDHGGTGIGGVGVSQVGYGIFIDNNSLNNIIEPTNTMDGDKILYYYNQSGMTIENYCLEVNSNPTNYGKTRFFFQN